MKSQINEALNHFTDLLADRLCGGSSRKLIAGWWYTILFISVVLTINSSFVVTTRDTGEGFSTAWITLLSVLLCIGGTMVMRKYNSSLSVGFFLGAVVGMSELFILLFFLYFGYGSDRIALGLECKQENIVAVICACQSLLLASFAAILGARRGEFVEQADNTPSNGNQGFRNQFGNLLGTNTVLANTYPYTPPSF